MFHGISDNLVTKRVRVDGTNYRMTLSGAATANGDAVSVFDYSTVRFKAAFSNIDNNANLSIKLQGSANGTTGWADVPGSTLAIVQATGANQIALLEVHRPQTGYLRMVTLQTQGGVTVGVDYTEVELAGVSWAPITQDATVAGLIKLVTP